MILTLAVFLALYLIPGLILSRLTIGKIRNQLFWWVLLSYLAIPFLYQLLAFWGQLSLVGYCLALMGLGLGVWLGLKIAKTKKVLPNIDKIFLKPKLSGSTVLRWASLALLSGFFLTLMLPRLGLWQGYLPVGDDKPRVGQVTSVAISPSFPLHFRLPTTEMSIYYYHLVQPGLLVKFTDNAVKVNQAWFLHLATTYILFGWLIWRLTDYFARSQLEKLTITFGLTFFSGLEFYLAVFKNFKGPHLEWWADWFSSQTLIHTQISLPYTANFWVTQHVMAVYFIFLIYLTMVSSEKQKLISLLFITLLIAALAGSSMFVFLTFALAYSGYFLIRLLLKKEKLWPVLKNHLVIGLGVLVLSAGLINLLFSSGKESYFVYGLNDFFLLPNAGINKLINLILTVPLYLTVELSFLVLAFGLAWYRFFKKRLYFSTELFLYLLLVPLGLIFFIKAKGDNNFSMRGTLPAVAVIAIFAGQYVGDLWEKWRRSKLKRRLLLVGLGLAAILAPPSMAWELYFRMVDQFSFKEPIYNEIDIRLPLRSIVFAEVTKDYYERTPDTNVTYPDNLVHMGHRLSFKSLDYFTITDTEYTSTAAKAKYATSQFNTYDEIVKFLDSEPDLKKKFNLYLLAKLDHNAPLKLKNGDYRVYSLNELGK